MLLSKFAVYFSLVTKFSKVSIKEREYFIISNIKVEWQPYRTRTCHIWNFRSVVFLHLTFRDKRSRPFS